MKKVPDTFYLLQIRQLGGELQYSHTNNPDHYLLNGLTGKQLESLFAPNVREIWKGGGR